MSNNEKIWVGHGKEFGNYGDINISVCLDDIPSAHKQTGKNGKTYLNLVVSKKREADQWGKTHSVRVDTWKPDQAPASQPSARPAPSQAPKNARPAWEDDADDVSIPF